MKNYELMQKLSVLPAGEEVTIDLVFREEELEKFDDDQKRLERDIEYIGECGGKIWIS